MRQTGSPGRVACMYRNKADDRESSTARFRSDSTISAWELQSKGFEASEMVSSRAAGI
jgi:hypothetical protein